VKQNPNGGSPLRIFHLFERAADPCGLDGVTDVNVTNTSVGDAFAKGNGDGDAGDGIDFVGRGDEAEHDVLEREALREVGM
jgi:hypothetical protein